MPSYEQSRARATSRRLRRLLPLVLAPVAFVGCGTSHVDRGSARPSTKAGRLIVRDTRASILVAIAACRRGVDTAYWLSPTSKQDLYRTCAGGLILSIGAEGEIGKQVCEEVSYTAPSASIKAHAFKACYEGVKLTTTVTQ